MGQLQSNAFEQISQAISQSRSNVACPANIPLHLCLRKPWEMLRLRGLPLEKRRVSRLLFQRGGGESL